MRKPMLTTLVEDAPAGEEWVYEVKYDGFRCGIEWTSNNIRLWSRNGNELTNSFPEIVAWCRENQHLVENQLPLFLDGELAVLVTEFQSVFSLIQQRGRLKATEKIQAISEKRPATFVIFDLIQLKERSLEREDFQSRRKILAKLSSLLKIDQFASENRLYQIRIFQSLADIQALITLHQSEGIVAKHKNSRYSQGKRTDQWLKLKNYRWIVAVITGFNTDNDYFDLSIANKDGFEFLGKVKNGFSKEEKNTLTTFIQQHGKKKNQVYWDVPPSICIGINCLDATMGDLREPSFRQFHFDLLPEQCTRDNIRVGLAQLPAELELSKPEKRLYPDVTKRDYVLYLRKIAPFLLARLMNKRLTMIRYPDGISAHFFYQKHLPDYAPDYIQTVPGEDEGEDILCQDLRSLLWFGNHGSLEFHVPFQTIDSGYPDEMVFDLDPPSLREFPLAVKAALLIKDMVAYQGFIPFVKTSGKTGLQIHIPLEEKSMSFDQTRTFMEAVANILVERYPESFTTERLIKNRGKRLYIDYVQHAPGKTIIAPYSLRATNEATVATPLYWDEVNEKLNPKDYTIKTVPPRLIEMGCPFQDMWNNRKKP